jgi:ribosome assembly protein RRB1
MDVDDEVMPAIEESDEQPAAPDVFIPGRDKLGPDEILEPDDSVYIMRHSMKVTWPCLSFDILRDNLGDERQRYPATSYLVAGTQADAAKDNEVVVYKLSSLHRTQKDGGKSANVICESGNANNALQTIQTLKMKTKKTTTKI